MQAVPLPVGGNVLSGLIAVDAFMAGIESSLALERRDQIGLAKIQNMPLNQATRARSRLRKIVDGVDPVAEQIRAARFFPEKTESQAAAI